MKAICSILFIIILAAPHMAFAAPASSDEPICVGSERIGIIGDTPFCKKLYDRYYECSDESYLDFYPDPPICRYKHNDKEAGNAFLKPIPGPSLPPKIESGNESSTDSGGATNEPISPDIWNDNNEWWNSNFYTVIAIAGLVIFPIIFWLLNKDRKKNSKKDVKLSNDGKTNDQHLQDSKMPIQKSDSTIVNPISDAVGKQYKSSQKDISINKDFIYYRTTEKSITVDKYIITKDGIIKHPNLTEAIGVIDTNIIYDYTEHSRNPEKDNQRLENWKDRCKKVQRYVEDKYDRNILYIPSEVIDEFENEIKTLSELDKYLVKDKYDHLKVYYDFDVESDESYSDRNYIKIPENPKSKKWKNNQKRIIRRINKFYKEIYELDIDILEDYDDEYTTVDYRMKERDEWLKTKMRYLVSENDDQNTRDKIKKQLLENLIKPNINSKNDRRILAKAIRLEELNNKEGRTISLFTNDSDFTAFSDSIDSEFRISIVVPNKLES